MRRPVDRERVLGLLARLGRCGASGRVYLVGGATAVMLGWRASTIDVDLAIEGEEDKLLRAFPALKEELEINLELAAPHHFLPELPGWRERSPFIRREGRLDFYHYDFYAQALAKIERGHARDLDDVRALLRQGGVETARLWRLFRDIEPQLYRYPAIDPASLRRQLEAAIGAEPPR